MRAQSSDGNPELVASSVVGTYSKYTEILSHENYSTILGPGSHKITTCTHLRDCTTTVYMDCAVGRRVAWFLGQVCSSVNMSFKSTLWFKV